MANTTDWLSISSSSGQSGQTTLTVTARKNLSGDFKTAEIRAYSPLYNVSSTTYVTMEQYGPYIYVSQNIFGIPASGGSYNLAITSNTSYVISFPEMVSTYSASAGTGNTAITFTVPALSDSSTTVVGNIVITDESGQYSTTVRLEEYGSDAYAHPSTGQLVFPASGGSLTFTVTANCVYNISDTISEWGTVSPRSGYTGVTTFTVTMNGANTGTSANTGLIFLTGPGGTGLVNVLQQATERRLAITYNVTSTTEPTQILSGYNGSLSEITKAEYNGNEITVDTGYTFPSTGQQTVYYTLSRTVVPESAFYECPVLAAVIPEGVTAVAVSAFNTAKLLQTVSFPNTLGIIRNSAFYDCSSLTSVTIPASVYSIGTSAFSGGGRRSGTVITRDDAGPVFVRFEGLTPPTLNGNTFHYNSAYTGYNLQEIRVPCASYNAYVSAMTAYTPIITCYSDTQLYFNTDTSNVAGTGETRTVTLLNYDLVENSIGTNWQTGEYWVCGNTIYIRYSQNPSSSSTRSWTINIYARTKDNKPLTGSFSITQNANYIYPIPYTADTSVVAASGETRTITIDTTDLIASSIAIGVEGATGVTYYYSNGVITVTFPENTGSGKKITLSVSANTTNMESAELVLYFVQLPSSEYSGEELTFNIKTNGVITWKKYSSSTQALTIQYSKNDGEWTNITSSTAGTSFNVNAGDTVRFRGDNSTYGWPDTSASTSSSVIWYPHYTTFCGSTASFDVEGNIMSLIDSTGFTGITSFESEYTFEYLFQNCKIESALNLLLPADTLTTYCYSDMFCNCTSLSTAPFALPATTLAANCYGGMFSWCTSLTTAPSILPATTLANFCYAGMFSNCTSLRTAPELPATTLAYRCYSDMFSDCTALTASPSILPATTLADMCYYYMFQNCSSLTTAPELPATTLATQCYSHMFQDCTSLTTAPELPATTLANFCYDGMFSNCTSLTTAPELPATTLIKNCYIYMFSGCTSLTTMPTLPATTLAESCYRYMFSGCTSLRIAAALPATSLYSAYNCYNGMFQGCTSLTTAPELPATTLVNNCYYNMFNGCTSLATAPSLPATTLVEGCYMQMFYGCTSLTTAPSILPATTLADSCYRSMFQGCTSLTTAPELPATTLAVACYMTMFAECRSLNYIKCLATDISATLCTSFWVVNVAASGTFVKNPNMSSWTTGESGIPSGWTVQDAT